MCARANGANNAPSNTTKNTKKPSKGTFLEEGERLGLPVTPFLRAPALFVKHRRQEGGLGIHVYKNFAAGGDWVLLAVDPQGLMFALVGKRTN